MAFYLIKDGASRQIVLGVSRVQELGTSFITMLPLLDTCK